MFSINHTVCTNSSCTKGHSSETRRDPPNLSSQTTAQCQPCKQVHLRTEVSGLLCYLFSARYLFPYLLLCVGSCSNLPVIIPLVLSIYPNPSLEDRFSSAVLCQLLLLLLSPSSELLFHLMMYHRSLFILELELRWLIRVEQDTGSPKLMTKYTTNSASRGASIPGTLSSTRTGVSHRRTQPETPGSASLHFLYEPLQNPSYYPRDFSSIGLEISKF